MFDDLLGETLAPVHVDYIAAQRAWADWFDGHLVPTNVTLDARLVDAGTRAGFVPVCRTRGYFHIPTREFVRALAAVLGGLPGPYVEVGAGQGVLAQAIREDGVPLIATDDGTWWPRTETAATDTERVGNVERADVPTALATHHPGTVLAVWPPRDTDWPALFRATPGVQAYLLIGDGTGAMTGNATTWGAAPGWRRTWLPHLAALGRCRLDADGTRHTRALLVRKSPHPRPLPLS